MVADTQLNGEFLDRFCVRVPENEHSVHIGNADSEEKRRGRTQLSVDDGDDSEVFPPPVGPL